MAGFLDLGKQLWFGWLAFLWRDWHYCYEARSEKASQSNKELSIDE
jgi:hypothetical protein